MQTLLFILTIMSGVAMVGLVTYILVGMFDTSIATKKRLEAVSGELQRKKEKEEERKSLAEEYRAQKKQGKETKNSLKVEAMLEMANVNMTYQQFTMLKVVAVVGLLFFTLIIFFSLGFETTTVLFIAVLAGIIGFVGPGMFLNSRVKKRKSNLLNQLPDIMDLLNVSVEAGLGLDAALVRLYEKNKSDMMTELMQATRDIQRGMKKKDAYNALAERCDVKELTSFLTALVQAEELGISIKSVLTLQAEAMRESRRQRAEEKALKAPVLMLLPMVGFIFPVIFIMLLGPAILTVMETTSF